MEVDHRPLLADPPPESVCSASVVIVGEAGGGAGFTIDRAFTGRGC